MGEPQESLVSGTQTRRRVIAHVAALVCAVGWLCVLPAQWGGVADATAEDAPRFSVVRTATLLIRIDSRTGQVWITPPDGADGWKRVGVSVTDGGPEEDGRYQVRVMGGQRKTQLTLGNQPNLELIRMDLLSGKAWLAEALPGATWDAFDAVPSESPADP